MKTFRHGGKIGDVIFSLPTIRELGGGILYLPETTPDGCNSLYSSLKDLLLHQPYIKEVREYPSGLAYMEQAPDIHIDYDLDLARLQPLKGVVHIVKRYMDAFNVNYPNWKEPWLVLPEVDVERWSRFFGMPEKFTLINYTGRHITNEQMKMTSKYDWAKLYSSLTQPVYFVGTFEEYVNFCENWNVRITHIPTLNMLQLAAIVKRADVIYCNQSSTLALAQSIGKTYYLEPKPHKTNCLLRTSNEHLL